MQQNTKSQELSLHRPPLKYQRYTLSLERLPHDRKPQDVYVRATPLIGDYTFINQEEDTKFNLSENVGLSNLTLEWGASGFNTAKGIEEISITIAPGDKTKERYLRVTVSSQLPGEPLEVCMLNLDEYLDLVESYDPQSGELKAKLKKKSKSKTRSIIMCFDGTSNHFSNQNTNVVKLMELLKKDDPEQQLVYYQPGVGTYTSPGLITGLGQSAAKTMDEAVAWFLYQHVVDGYKYLMQTYRAGDQISIFGFSRGAYTARALAGMLHSVGLLPRDNTEQASFAYEVYATSKDELVGIKGLERVDSPPGRVHVMPNKHSSGSTIDSSAENTDPRIFKRAFCIPVTIAFLGVWDTVGSVGSVKLTRETLPWIEYNPSVRNFRQALALDENRGNFIPSLWNHARNNLDQSTLEVWFKGGHSDIGGGASVEQPVWDITALSQYDPSYTDRDFTKPLQTPWLSNIALRWMVRQCLSIPEARVLFDPTTMRIYRDSGILETRPIGSEGEDPVQLHALQVALRDKLDEHDISPEPYLAASKNTPSGWFWWGLDKLPIPKLSQTAERTQPPTDYWPNNGGPRVIRYDTSDCDCVQIHTSAYIHIAEGKYQPPALWAGWPDTKWPRIHEGKKWGALKKDTVVQPHFKMSPERKASVANSEPSGADPKPSEVGWGTSAANFVRNLLR